MLGFNGGLIGTLRSTNLSIAPGLWTPNEQVVAQRAGVWPKVYPLFRYYRFNNFAATSLDSNAIDLGEIELYAGDTKHTGITCTTSWTFDGGDASLLVNGIIDDRAYYVGWSSIQSTATITFDLGSAKTVTHVWIYSRFTPPRFPASFDLQGSTDNSSYTTLGTVTVGTSFTLVSGTTYTSGKVAV
jgi:hypothetical protein